MEWTARTWFTAGQKRELWERWKDGQCVADIARALGRRNKSGVYRILARDGGVAPLPRRRAAVALRLEEREEISRGIAAGQSIRRIAHDLGRSPSTISREVVRNGGSQAYRASLADNSAWDRALRPKPCRLALHAPLRWRIAQKLALEWSPKQIAGWLQQQFSTDPNMQLSHESIYRSLFVQTRGVLKEVKRWPATRALPSPPMCQSIFVIPTVPGNAAQTKTQMACCASIFQRELTSRRSPRPISTRSRGG